LRISPKGLKVGIFREIIILFFFHKYVNHGKHANTIWEIIHPKGSKFNTFKETKRARSFHFKTLFKDLEEANIG